MKLQFRGLFYKVYGLILLPSIAFMTLSGIFLFDNFKKYQTNNAIQEEVPVIRAAVNLLFLMQVERGMSIAYVNGADNWDKIKNHRLKVNEKFKNYESVSTMSESEKVSQETLAFIQSALSMRNDIEKKLVGKKDIAPIYTKAIRNLMAKVDTLTTKVESPELIRTLVNINEFSEAKENGGLLRANLSAILARKKGLNSKEFDFITKLNSNFNAYSRSTSLKLFSEDSKLKYDEFKNGPEHEVISKTVSEVLSNPTASSYGIGSNEFFKTISSSLGKLNNTLLSEISRLESFSEQTLISSRNNLIFMGSIILLYLIIASTFTTAVVFKLVRQFRDNLHTLNNKTLAISLSTENLNENSRSVHQASSTQSQDIEETSSAVHEINKIQESTSGLIIDSKKLTDSASQSANKGMTQVQEMLKSISKISDSNKDLANQVRENNQSFEKVTNVINEIADKTSIINDIVFQTKLLSFNASVEAARAGEHGKGFSVVAEEIGQLANLSGNAANEIADLVSSSIELVTSMTKEMSEKMDGFVDNSNKNIQTGNKEAQNCSELFSQMVQSVRKLESAMTQIESASMEQSEAIANISRNVSTLDNATKSNLSSIDDNFSLSEKIAKSSKELKHVVDDMCIIIRGELISDSDREKYHNKVSNLKVVNTSNSNDKKAA